MIPFIVLFVTCLVAVGQLNAQTLDVSVCRDKIDNCSQYGRSACTNYEPWARDNCLAYCGFCVGPPTTPVPCADKLDDCQSFGKQVCTDPKYAPWVLANCRYFCRQCTDEQIAIADSKTTTLPPPACVNKLDNCPRYGQKACTNFKPWAQDNCRYYCRFCTPEQLLAADSKTTTTSTTTTTTIATPGIPCVDKLPHCDVYDDAMCTTYRPWAEENCRAYCLICTPSGFVPVGTVGPGIVQVQNRGIKNRIRSFINKLKMKI